MTDSDDAYRRAEAAIERAGEDGATDLDLSEGAGFRALDRLPPGIGGLTGPRSLALRGTRVSDLTPLAGLAGLETLLLDNTRVADLAPLAGLTRLRDLTLSGTPCTDLRPLRGLTLLAEYPGSFGLEFKDCAAARADPRIAEIAGIADNAKRARALFDYLEGWQPPDDPEPDPLVAIEVQDGRLEIAASLPTEAERDEALKQALHGQLRDECAALVRAAGNRFPRVMKRARSLFEQLDRPFAELDLLRIHLALPTLQAWRREGQEDDEPFSAELNVALDQVLAIGPGLTLDHPDVDLFEQRRRAFTETPRPEAARAAHDAFSRVLIDAPNAVGRTCAPMRKRSSPPPTTPPARRCRRRRRATSSSGWRGRPSRSVALRQVRSIKVRSTICSGPPAISGSPSCNSTASLSSSGSCPPSPVCPSLPRWRKASIRGVCPARRRGSATAGGRPGAGIGAARKRAKVKIW